MSANKKSDTVQVIGAGFGRTGTHSLKNALEILGYNPTYHMVEVFKNPSHAEGWIALAENQPYDFDKMFCDKDGKPVYTATVDFPSAWWWKEQLEQYPNAKVILTVRDGEKWYKSARETIFQAMYGSPYQRFGIKFLDMIGMGRMPRRFFQSLGRAWFGGRWSKEELIESFNKHNERVIRECPKDKLLVFQVSEGWGPLCEFLGKPIPSEPFPNVNDTAEFQGMLSKVDMIGYTMMAAMVLVPVGVAFLFGKCRAYIESPAGGFCKFSL